jgi:thiol-disulfide isomerase/thioredoxin
VSEERVFSHAREGVTGILSGHGHPFRVPTILLLVVVVLLCAGCISTTESPEPVTGNLDTSSLSVERVEVYHFHGNQQCPSCIAVGNLAEKTVNTYFKGELASGRLVFGHVNVQQPENAALAERYGVTGSSLWIGIYDSNGFHKEQDIRVWSLINDEEAYSKYLSGILSRRLNGDLT